MQTKKIITRDNIKHDLLTLNAEELRFALTFICIALVIVSVPTAILFFYLSLSSSADLTEKIIIGVLLSFFVCLTVGRYGCSL